ncbi:MAG: response regulator [Hespellia sp.]|nr:response regulator [Hespellia sp.]
METQKVILIVDDVEINRVIMKISFADDCGILEAREGRECLRLLEKNKVDLIITDIMMNGMNGYELIQTLKADERYRDIPIIAVTEHDEVEQQRVLSLGADEFVCKPFVTRSLRSCVSGILFGERIRSKLEQFHQVFDENPIPFMLYCLYPNHFGEYYKYEIAYMNDAAADLLNTKKELILGRSVTEISSIKLEFLVQAHEGEERCRDILYDEKSKRHLDITCYRESENYVAMVLTDITEQIRQKELVQSERDRYSHLLDAIPSGIAVFDIVRGKSVKVSYINDEICKISGFERAELAAMGCEEICRAIPEDLQRVSQTMREAVDSERPIEVEYRICRKDGEQRFLRMRVAVEHSGKEDLIVYVTYIDITLRKQAEQAIETAMAYLNEAQDKNLLGKCRANVTKNIIDNYSGDGRLLIAADDPLYSNTVEYVAALCTTDEMKRDFRRKMMPDKLCMSFEKGNHELKLEYMRLMSDGNVSWVATHVKLYRDPESQDIMAFMYTYDIDREKTMQMIVDHVTQHEFDMLGLLYTKNGMLHTVRASEMERRLNVPTDTNYPLGVQQYVSRFIEDDQKNEVARWLSFDKIQEELKNKKVYTVSSPVIFENKVYHKKWEYSYLDDSHEVIIFTRSDITELFEEQMRQRENLRNALLQAEQANHAKTDFLSHMSHEIRTPMNAIIGMSTLAAQCVNDPKQVLEYISKVGISARFLLSLINDILDMSRIESGKVTLKYEKFSLEKLIDNINTIVYNQAKEKDVAYECVIASFINANYIGDEMKLQQILINILGNAIKFTPHGGKTQFLIRQNKVENGKAYLTFTVNDTGIGISEEFRAKMFEPFEQQNQGNTAMYQGTGLGLAICKNFVNMMGGTIAVNSMEGMGTEFTVNLTLTVCEDELECADARDTHVENLKTQVMDDSAFCRTYYEKAQKEEKQKKCEYNFEERRILLAEDHMLNVEVAKRLLESRHAKVEVAENGLRAIEMFAKSQLGYYDAILMDIRMPVMDGLTSAQSIRHLHNKDAASVPIIAMSANAFDEDVRKSKSAGMNAHLAKPIEPQILYATLEKFFIQKDKKEAL